MATEIHTNSLARETSPYLLQHAHNPVDWYAWGPQAFAAAREQDKPIFLSVGYSTCYWCHVMERESFENPDVAQEMNRLFINIKVDREERPDVDQLYMLAVQLITHQGGWPMSVFLTPQLKPFYGGTYFPPADAYGRPGFVTLLRNVAEAYRRQRDKVELSADQLLGALAQLSEPRWPRQKMEINHEWVAGLVERSVADYDPDCGGFGSAPKFPRQTLLQLLLVYNCHFPFEPRMRMVRHTLDAMQRGGIHDHLGGGFHRYSTDQQWLTPHFEIMLYDNAMLAWVYVEAFRQTQHRPYAQTARGIFDFVLREMTSPQGAFYTAFDAEVDAREGLSYLWTPAQIDAALQNAGDAALFKKIYGLDAGPNFADPHHGNSQPEMNILHLPLPLEESAAEMGMELEKLEARLAELRQTLYAARKQRKGPMLDTKILTSWNALMIRALAHGAKVLREPAYLAAAARAGRFLRQHHATADGALLRTSRDGPAKTAAFLEDYAFVVQAMLALHEAGGGREWRDQAQLWADRMQSKFGDEAAGGFFFTAQQADELPVRQKMSGDSPLPSGNAVAAMVQLDLGQPRIARQTLALFAQALADNAESMSALLEAAVRYLSSQEPIGVEASADQRPPTPQETAAGIVAVGGAWASQTELHVHMNIAKGWHLRATQLRILGAAAAHVAVIDMPPGDSYVGQLALCVQFNCSMAGREPLQVALSYQACDDKSCLPEITRQLPIAAP